MSEASGRAREGVRALPRPGPERVLACVGLAFGGLLLAITPPFQVPDEQVHFLRAFQVSEGGLVAEKREGRSGGFVPESLLSVSGRFMHLPFHPEARTTVGAILAAFSVPLDGSLRRFVGFENTTVQTPVSYLPQSLGIRLGRALDLGPLALLYLGRGANLLVSLLVLLLAIRAAPVFKWVFALLGSMPMAVFQMASVSADALTNAVALLWTAMILRLALSGSGVDARALAALFAASLCLSLSKLAYSPLLLLFLAIPVSRLGGARHYFGVFAALAGLNAVALGGWVWLMRDVYVPITWMGHVDPAAQLRFIAAHPLQFAGMLLDRFSGPGAGALWDLMVGRVLGWLDTPMPYAAVLSYQLVLIAAALVDSRSEIRVGARLKLLAFCVLVVGLATVGTMVYLQGHPVGASYLADIHGRYLIPLSPLPLLVLYNRTLRASLLARFPREPVARACSAGLAAFLVFSSALTCFVLVRRYYL
jgi:uncharacterized membrane protein